MPRWVGGHIMFSHTDLMRLPGEKLFAAVVRNPLHQVVSHYEFVRNQPAHPYHTDLPLEKALTSHTAFVQASRNMQCRYIASQHTFANAMKVIKANPFAIGSYDQLDLFVDYICSYLDIPKLSLPHENTQQPGYFEKHCTPIARDLIYEMTREDALLYAKVQRRGLLLGRQGPRGWARSLMIRYKKKT